MKTLVLGGSASGKSAHAEHLLAGASTVLYVAAGPSRPDDHEWAARVAAHQLRRPPTWSTLETLRLEATLSSGEDGAVLIDSVTTWLAGAMDDLDFWAALDTTRLTPAVDGLVAAFGSSRRRVVAVSDEVGSGVVPETPAGRAFRDHLGRLNQRLAAAADEVLLVVAGIPTVLK